MKMSITNGQGQRVAGIQPQFILINFKRLTDHPAGLNLCGITIARDGLTDTFDTVFNKLNVLLGAK